MFNKDYQPTNLTQSQNIELQTMMDTARIQSSIKCFADGSLQLFKEHFQYESSLTHFNNIIYGYDMQATSNRIPQYVIDSTIKPSFKLTEQVKQFFDCLYKYEVSPSKQFEKFLIAVNSLALSDEDLKLIVKQLDQRIEKKILNQNEEQLTPPQKVADEYEISITQSQQDSEQTYNESEQQQQLEPLQTQESLYTSVVEPYLDLIDSRVKSNILEKNQSEQQETDQDQHIQTVQRLVTQFDERIQWLLKYIKDCKKYLLSFYTQFYKDFSTFLYEQPHHQRYAYQTNKNILFLFLSTVAKKIQYYINGNIIKPANEIYKILTHQFNPQDHVLVYSPSKLIINSAVIYNEYLIEEKIANNFQVTLIYTDKLSLQEQLQTLVQHKVKVNYVSLDILPHFLQQQHPTVMLIGCQEITLNANIVSRAGCTSAAIFCSQAQIPIVAVSELYKFGCQENEQGEGIEIVDSNYIQAIICERGVLSCQSVRTYSL